MVKYINQSPAKVVSIDIPSGLMCEDNTYNIHTNIIHADLTLTLQQKKLSMILADNQVYLGRLKVLDIHPTRLHTLQHRQTRRKRFFQEKENTLSEEKEGFPKHSKEAFPSIKGDSYNN